MIATQISTTERHAMRRLASRRCMESGFNSRCCNVRPTAIGYFPVEAVDWARYHARKL
jgi:hypothetical protein